MKISLLILFLGLTFKLFAQNSYIQVVSESGISVFLDNTFKGKTTSELGGLIIENVTSGNHLIKVVKDGFSPLEDNINVKPGQVFTYNVKPFIPKITITQQGSAAQEKIDLKVGKLKIQSLPVAIDINIPELGLVDSKNKDEWMGEKIPVGSYAGTFSWNGKALNYTINIRDNRLTRLFVDMIKGEISEVGPQFGTLTDSRDGKTYKTVQIGDQIWMAENLAYKSSFCNVYNKDESYLGYYGYLYGWGVNTNVCPTGWHLPSMEEAYKLLNNLKDYGSNERDLLVKGGDTGFSAVYGGGRAENKKYIDMGSKAYFATSYVNGTYGGQFEYIVINRNSENVFIEGIYYLSASVRCIKDE